MVYSTTGMIKRQMEARDCRYWTVSDSSENIIATSEKDSGTLTPNTSFEKLLEVLNECSGDYVRVTIRTHAANAGEGVTPKGSSKYGPYYLQCTPVKGAAINGTGGGGDMSLHKQIWQLEQALRDKDQERKMEALEKKIEGLTDKKSESGLFEKFFDKLANNIADKLTGDEIRKAITPEDKAGAPKETPVSEEPIGDNPEEEKNVIVSMVKNAAAAVGDKDKTMKGFEALAKMAKAQPKVFAQTVDALIAQYGTD